MDAVREVGGLQVVIGLEQHRGRLPGRGLVYAGHVLDGDRAGWSHFGLQSGASHPEGFRSRLRRKTSSASAQLRSICRVGNLRTAIDVFRPRDVVVPARGAIETRAWQYQQDLVVGDGAEGLVFHGFPHF